MDKRGRQSLFVAAASLVFTLGYGEDLVDTRGLGTRGVILEAPIDVLGCSNVRKPAGVGDMNGDGFDDVGVIYAVAPNEVGERWELAITYGRRDLTGLYGIEEIQETAVFRIASPLGGQWGFETVRSMGDIDGDGLADILIGLPTYALSDGRDRTMAGVAFIVFGDPGLVGRGAIEEILDLGIRGIVLWSSDPTHGAVGHEAALLGDVNGDGREDLAIGAPNSDVGEWTSAGSAFVVFGADDLPARVDLVGVGDTIPGFVIRGTNVKDTPDGTITRGRGALGSSLAPAGDVNGDGLADFLVGAPDISTLYLVRGALASPPVIELGQLDEDGLERLGITVFLPPNDNRGLGGTDSFTGIGDLDGDGRSELIVGVPAFRTLPRPDYKNSEVFLFWGRNDLPARVDMGNVPAELATVFRPPTPIESSGFFGSTVAPAGDLNGDSFPDFFVGAPHTWRDGVANVGEAYAIYSRMDMPFELDLRDGFEGIRILGESLSHHFGSDIASAGDFNGDGALDLIVSAPHCGPPPDRVPQGRAYLIYGSGADGPPLSFLSISPDFGTVRGGTPTVIRGSGFEEDASVHFGASAAMEVRFVSSSELHVVSSAAAAPGKVDLTIVAAGISVVIREGWEYVPHYPQFDVSDLGRRGVVLRGPADFRIGESMAIGDLDGDGRSELVTAVTPEAVEPTWSAVVLRGGAGWTGLVDVSSPAPGLTTIDLSILGRGGVVEIVGDVNGDGFADLAIGAAGAQGAIVFGRSEFPATLDLAEEISSGRAVRLSDAAPPPETLFDTFEFAPAGDVDGDGIDDLAIGLSGDGSAAGQGRIAFLAGRRDWPEEVDPQGAAGRLGLLRGGAGEGIGLGLVAAGDVNGDGRVDFLTSTTPPPSTPAPAPPRRGYLIYGPQAPFGEVSIQDAVAASSAVTFAVEGPLDDPEILRVAAAGDVDGDGLDDILLGLASAGRGDFEGRVHLVWGSDPLPPSVDLPGFSGAIELIGPASQAEIGRVGPAGDWNADGFDDFLVASGPIGPPGSVYVIFGSPELPESIDLAGLRGLGLRIEGVIPFGVTTVPLRGAGDFDGDGVSDVVFAEFGIEDPSGRVYVLFGVTPETLDAEFVRGDANDDGTLDISDAAYSLNWLFNGGAAPPCADAADVDDDGLISITDPIVALDFLFRGGRAPPAPSGACGRDPTADGLHCSESDCR